MFGSSCSNSVGGLLGFFFCFVLFWTGCSVALADLEFRFLLPLASNTGITGTSFMVMYLRHGLHFSYGYKLASLLSK